MTVKYIGDGNYVGLAGDTKPTTAATNSKFWETDTNKVSVYNGTAWLGSYIHGAYEYIVYPDGSNYVYQDYAGEIQLSSSSLSTLLATVIALGKDTYIAPGTYTFAGGFTPITWPTAIVFKVHAAKSAKFIIPAGYADAVFKMNAPVSHCEYWGGQFEEAATFSRNWYPFELKNDTGGGASGNFFNKVGGYKVKQAKAMIKISQWTTGGWLSSNMIEQLTGWDCKYAIEFYKDAAATGAAKIYEQTFKDIKLQTDAATLTGAQNVQGESHTFENVMIWDLALGAGGAGAASCWILADTKYLRIRGGNMASSLMTNPEYDQSANQDTLIDSEYENRAKFPKIGESLFATGYQWGWAHTGQHLNEGILGAGATMTGGTPVAGNISNTGGIYLRYPTTATGGSLGGKRINNVAMRALNSRLSVRFRLAQVTGSQTRVWIGWTTGAADPTGDTELSGKSAFMLILRLADTNYQIGHNAAATPATYIDTGVAASNTNWHTLELLADDTRARFLWRLDGGFSGVTTNIPASTTALNLHYGIQTGDTTIRSWDLGQLEVRNDRK